MSKKIIGVVLMVITVAAGFYVDIVKFLIGGIVEVVHGVQAHPVNGGDIGWGIAKALVFNGLGISAAVILCVSWFVLFFREPWPRGWKHS